MIRVLIHIRQGSTRSPTSTRDGAFGVSCFAMAKTKGSDPPFNEFSYRDADGTNHFLGEFLRSIFGEGSISRYDPTVDNMGISQRGLRPSQQGAGSADQEQYRDNFLNCIALWNSLPEECPDPLPEPHPTSKQSVWEAKLEHGVVCSYFDLFLRCCLKWAIAHGDSMPDGDCFPCVSLCDCTGISIAYTTKGMQVDEIQGLGVSGAIEGCEYLWRIDSGDGSLSAESGSYITYYAPSSNAECESNVTISLLVGDVVCDTIQIAINAYFDSGWAYMELGTGCFSAVPNGGGLCGDFVCNRPYCWQCCAFRANCDGSVSETTYTTACWGYAHHHCDGAAWCGLHCSATGYQDLRSPAMITQGCCPGELL